MKELKVDLNSIIQHCIWSKLNNNLKKQFRLITNKNTPSLKEIEDNFFAAIERYNSEKEQQKSSRKETEKFQNTNAYVGSTDRHDFADNISFKNECVLCKVGQQHVAHPIYKCEKYKGPKEKLDRLRELKRCIRCTKEHVGFCQFEFQKRCECGYYHFSFLCLKRDGPFKYVKRENYSTERTYKETKKTDTEKTDDKNRTQNENLDKKPIAKVNTGTVWIGKVSSGQAILPTVTGQSGQCEFTILADTGSQSTFISENLAKNLDCEVIENAKLTINGMNVSKDVDVKYVKVKVNIGKVNWTVDAIVVPEINIEINIPSLVKIEKYFKNAGYKLADRNLGRIGTSSTIEMILGIDQMIEILNPQTVKLGDSFYFQTTAGVLLAGNPEKIEGAKNFLQPVANHNVPSTGTTDFTEPDEEFETNLDENSSEVLGQDTHSVPVDMLSDFKKLIKSTQYVDNLKPKFNTNLGFTSKNYFNSAEDLIILNDQKINFEETFEVFQCKNRNLKHMPDLLTRFNVKMDETSLRGVNECESFGPVERWKNKSIKSEYRLDFGPGPRTGGRSFRPHRGKEHGPTSPDTTRHFLAKGNVTGLGGQEPG